MNLLRAVINRLPLAVLVGKFLGCAVPLHAKGPPSLCLGPDAVSATILAELKTLLSATDTGNVNWRARLDLTSVAASQVTLTTTASTCQSAVNALNTLRQHTTSGRKVYVFKLGTKQFAVWDPTSADVELTRGDRLRMYFTSAWVYKSSTTH